MTGKDKYNPEEVMTYTSKVLQSIGLKETLSANYFSARYEFVNRKSGRQSIGDSFKFVPYKQHPIPTPMPGHELNMRRNRAAEAKLLQAYRTTQPPAMAVLSAKPVPAAPHNA